MESNMSIVTVNIGNNPFLFPIDAFILGEKVDQNFAKNFLAQENSKGVLSGFNMTPEDIKKWQEKKGEGFLKAFSPSEHDEDQMSLEDDSEQIDENDEQNEGNDEQNDGNDENDENDDDMTNNEDEDDGMADEDIPPTE